MSKGFCCSSISKKAVTAVTGLLLFGFVVAHMLGNLQIFLGQDALNAYAKKLQEMPVLLWPARLFLLVTLLLHLLISIRLQLENRRARPVPYHAKDTVQASLASRTMLISGSVILLFVVYHLLHYTFKVTHPHISHLMDAKGRHDVYSMVVLSFQDSVVAAAYVFSMAVLCFHLSHGLASMFQTLGMNDERHQARVSVFARLMSVFIFVGNSLIPAAAWLGYLKLPQG